MQVEDDLWVANVIGQEGLRAKDGRPPVRYAAIGEGLGVVRAKAEALGGASVHMPRIGCGLAGGKWEEMEPVIARELAERGVPVTVYALP